MCPGSLLGDHECQGLDNAYLNGLEAQRRIGTCPGPLQVNSQLQKEGI